MGPDLYHQTHKYSISVLNAVTAALLLAAGICLLVPLQLSRQPDTDLGLRAHPQGSQTQPVC